MESKASSIVEKGKFLGEVDAGWTTTGDRLHVGKFVSRHYSLSDAESVDAANLGGLIVETPAGVFNYYRTELVSFYNLSVSGLDTGDSEEGLLMNHSFQHAWLRLCSKIDCRLHLLEIY